MHGNMKKLSRAGYRFRFPGVTWALAQGYSGDGSPDAEFECLGYNTRKTCLRTVIIFAIPFSDTVGAVSANSDLNMW